jgi:hypothetical protein
MLPHGQELMVQQIQVIQTQYGELHGRDTIHLDNIHFDYHPNVLTLIGQINALNLVGDYDDKEWLDFEFTFKDVLVMQMIELDSWWTTAPKEWNRNGSSFDEMLHSEWLLSWGGKVQPDKHRHFILVTYDDVFQIICEDVEIHIET